MSRRAAALSLTIRRGCGIPDVVGLGPVVSAGEEEEGGGGGQSVCALNAKSLWASAPQSLSLVPRLNIVSGGSDRIRLVVDFPLHYFY